MYAIPAFLAACAAVAFGVGSDDGQCPDVLMGTPEADSDPDIPTSADYAKAVAGLDMEAVQADMTKLLAESKDCWPADFANYGPFMIRLAWHCSGTYRNSDGVGGCAGGRQRFEPERSWPDNTNLDKARALLYPLKRKYGKALSWGDLLILAGTTALRNAGAPISKMCFGREDEVSGAKGAILDKPCPEQGKCGDPWGATTVGLIYVNPEGPLGVPDAHGSVADIRRTFKTMGHSDLATVALIGGGHALGKAHGACDKGPGLPPKEAFARKEPIWKGLCGTGKGADTVTAGFEGAWTSKPLQWDNEYFKDMAPSSGNKWEVWKGPGGHWQWRLQGGDENKRLRLTSDVALLEDDTYLDIVEEFARNMTAFNKAFDDAWYTLTVEKVGGVWSPNAKCDDGSVPPPPPSVMLSDDGPTIIAV